MSSCGLASLAVVVAILLASGAQALPVDLVDDNASARIDPTSPIGLAGWNVAGINHVSRQSLYVRVGDAGPEVPLSDLPASAPVLSDSDGDGDDDVLALTYASDALAIDVRWSLDGGPLGPPSAGASASLGLQVNARNLSGQVLDLHLFQYTDVDLFGTFADDALAITPATGSNTATAIDSTALALYEAVFTPAASAVEAATFGTTLPRLEDGQAIALDGALDALGDVTWTAEFSSLLAPGGSLSLALGQRIEVAGVPEPGSALSLGVALCGWALRRRSLLDAGKRRV
ncbi:MAG: PEP-CTERM sorting domain-containing protein [Myxococcota bacterium]